MPPRLKSFLQGWIINTLAVLVATEVVPGIDYDHSKIISLLTATLLLVILNAFVRPVMMLLSLPLMIFSFGLFILVINALLLLAVSWLMKPNFHVDSFGAAFWGGLVISIISLLLNSLTKSGSSRIEVRRGKNPPRDDGKGPVIDV